MKALTVFVLVLCSIFVFGCETMQEREPAYTPYISPYSTPYPTPYPSPQDAYNQAYVHAVNVLQQQHGKAQSYALMYKALFFTNDRNAKFTVTCTSPQANASLIIRGPNKYTNSQIETIAAVYSYAVNELRYTCRQINAYTNAYIHAHTILQFDVKDSIAYAKLNAPANRNTSKPSGSSASDVQEALNFIELLAR